MSVIHATISPSILSKADRLFRNDDDGVFVELLQNARRAGATVVEIEIEKLPGDDTGSRVVIQDNGSGVEDFQSLLTLGGSDWSAEVHQSEDPAGMGFFALCHSDVVVISGTRSILITREVFLGTQDALVVPSEEEVRGTKIIFTRLAPTSQLVESVKRVSRFGPLQVVVNNEEVTRYDFLEGSIHREVIDGIEVGFASHFRWNYGMKDDNWNFHGLCIRNSFDSTSGLLSFDQRDGWSRGQLHARFNVLETGRVKLQLPDRRSIVQDERLQEFHLKIRAAVYRFFQSQERHALSFTKWKEARVMGIILPEAAPLLRTWHAPALDEYLDPFFDPVKTQLLGSLSDVCIVDTELPNKHSFEAALQGWPSPQYRLYQEEGKFEGYTWYDALPHLKDCAVMIDGTPYSEWAKLSLPRPDAIEIVVTMEQFGKSDSTLRLPAHIHVVDGDDIDWNDEQPVFVAVKKSPWDNEKLDGPFDVTDFLLWATFQSSDDRTADSWETQRERYQGEVERKADLYFRGARAALLGLLQEALTWDARQYAKEAGVCEIRFRQQTPNGDSWDVELIENDRPNAGGHNP
jgi:hypothetical protein